MWPSLRRVLVRGRRTAVLRSRLFSRAATSTSSTAARAIQEIEQLYARNGNSDYVGENVSQIEHALQAAQLAHVSGLGDEAVLAALLHDCGHLLGLDDPSMPRMEDCGVVNHENLGGNWLRDLGFSDKVATLVARHVDAKRYLCCVQDGYHERLSDASKTTLRHQGGPMTPDEAKSFERSELFKTIIAMRHWDEAAKVPKKEVPGLEAYKALIASHVAGQPAAE
eukprot:TRINITY_DN3350_c0_g1_i1.p2 TRINITY_DN3350_c0_g1~~TRINITY_DN3350_c0_g1_i1.p2  ORF type:complete len:224 (-),score=51.33 TRINITY_DN3350_c0_g1_i1:316-987(-)